MALAICLLAGRVQAASLMACSEVWTPFGLGSDTLQVAPALQNIGFIVPNETHPNRLKAALSKVKTGVYLSVGTERGLIGAGLAEGRVTALVQIDRYPNVIAFNQINRALLSLSKNREQYLHLRLKGTFSEVQRLVSGSDEATKHNLSEQDYRTLTNQHLWAWWVQNVQNLKPWNLFHSPSNENLGGEFAEANYLYDEKMFEVVSNLAKKNRIFIWHVDLGSTDLALRIQSLTAQIGSPVSVADLSNSWQEGYLGYKGSWDFLTSIQNYSTVDSKLILSFLRSTSVTSVRSEFDYSVLSFGEINSLGQLQQHMGMLARQEASLQKFNRSRTSRFD